MPVINHLAAIAGHVESLASKPDEYFDPTGEIGSWDKPEKAFAETKLAVAVGNSTLFEATVISGRLLARHDILQRFGKTLRLIEVKSASIDTAEEGETLFRGKRGGIDAAWRQYVDAAGMTIEYRRNHSLEVPPICKHYVKSIYMRKTRSMKLIPFLTEDRARSIHREFGTPKL